MNSGGALPGLPTHFVGRDEQVALVEAKFSQGRLVSVIGAGGLGKTTLAVAVARRMAPGQSDGVCFVDLASLSDSEHLPARLAAALGIEVTAERMTGAVLQHLRGRRLLLVLDSCETVIEAAARLAEEILSAAPAVLLLATSREPLQTAGEWVHRLAPLGCPPLQRAFPSWLAMSYPAVQLFLRIAQDRRGLLAPSPADVERVAAVCCQLEGGPLAIALVASQVGPLGLDGVAAQMGSGLLTLSSPEGDGPPRHRTLEDVLSWSYRLLKDREQQAFCSLALFRGSFDLAAALAVAGDGQRVDTMSAVLDLVDKSLLATVPSGDTVDYRMADTTRAFGLDRLEALGADAYRASRRRHARFMFELLATVNAWPDHGRWVEDVRWALQWALSADGDRLLAVELTLRTVALVERTFLFSDFLGLLARAVVAARLLDPPRPDLVLRLETLPRIDSAQAFRDEPRQVEFLIEALESARASGETTAQMTALLPLFGHRFQFGDYPQALAWSNQIQALAERDADAFVELTARRTRAQALHFLGDHAVARSLAQTICSQPALDIPAAYGPSAVSAAVSMRIVLARILWLEGRAEQALRVVHECLALAEQGSHAARCQALALAAMPIGLWCGHLPSCRAWLEQLVELVERHHSIFWRPWCCFYASQLGLADEAARGIALEALQLPDMGMYRDHVATFDAATLTQDGSARVQVGRVGWCAPELLRLQAESAFARGEAEEAASDLARSIELARAQGALAWELRSAITALRLSVHTGTAARGRQRLASVYGRFSEGFETRDLQIARSLLSAGA